MYFLLVVAAVITIAIAVLLGVYLVGEKSERGRCCADQPSCTSHRGHCRGLLNRLIDAVVATVAPFVCVSRTRSCI